MIRTFNPDRWPNLIMHQPPGHYGGHTGISPFSQGEIQRRQDLVRAKLSERNCDLLITQGCFPPATMGCQTTLYWLTGYNGYRNTMTLILPKDGELIEVPGVKRCSNRGCDDPYTGAVDMAPYLRGARRIAYDGVGYMTYQFRDYLLQTCPGVEIIDFSNELDHMKSKKSEEEMAAVRDAIHIQDIVFSSAATFIQPGRTCQEVLADITRAQWMLGADATLMGKVLIDLLPNRALGEGEVCGGHAADPGRRIQETDRVRLGLEGPGSGGYYSQRGRDFFFDTPHEDIQIAFDRAKGLYEYTWPLLTPGRTKQELLELTNAYKIAHGIAPIVRDEAAMLEDRISGLGNTGVIRGLGMLTVDRPQDQFDWEDMDISVGHTLVVGGFASQNGHRVGIAEMCLVTDQGPEIPGRYPLELVVL